MKHLMTPNGITHFYKEVPGYFDFEQVYKEAVEWLPDGGTFVEIGCWQGMSLAYFLVEARLSSKKLKVFGVDHFRGSVNDGPLLREAGIKSIAGHCFHNLRRAGYPYALINAESVVGSTFIPDGSCDYVFIDGSHDYDSVRDDLRVWLPKVKPGGIIAGHDFNQPEVERAVREAFPGRYIEHLKNRYMDRGYEWGTCWRVRLEEHLT